MTQTIRYGIIGCGSMGREHIENIQALPRTEGGASVTALADPHAPSCDAALAIERGKDPADERQHPHGSEQAGDHPACQRLVP